MNRHERKKRGERFYLDAFLRSGALVGEVVDGFGESPDFLVKKIDGDLAGVEVRQVFGGDTDDRGSAERRAESADLKWFIAVRERYYALGGVSIDVMLQTNHMDLDGASIEEVAAWLVAEAQRAAPNTDFEAELLGDSGNVLRATAWVYRLPEGPELPEEFKQYRRGWRLLDHAIGWCHTLTTELVQTAIDGKAEKLPAYRTRVATTILLLVADSSLASGMFMPGNLSVEARGFDSVFLLRHPVNEVTRIAGGVR